jgi:hypothetical protein
LVDQLLSNFNYRTVWNDSLFHIYKETESSDGGISSTIILTEEWKIRKKLTTDFIKNIRKDYINRKLTCEQKQLNLETSYKTFFETAKQRNWLYTGTVYDTEGDLKKLFNEISYPCSNFQKEKLRHDIRMRRTWWCSGKNSWAPVLCEDTRKILEKYDKEFLDLINKYWVDNLKESNT